MDVKVASKLVQAFSRSLGSLSLANGSMLLRMRRASFALFALVGVVGFGLIVFIAQLGWPGVVSGPLPGPPTQAGTVENAVALNKSAVAPGGPLGPAAVADGSAARDLSQRGSPDSNGSGEQGSSQLSEAEKLAAAPVAQPGQESNQPAAQPPSSTTAPEPAPAPTPTPAPSTVAAESPPQPSSSADQAKKASSNPRTTETAVSKAVSDSAGSSNSSAKSQGQKSANDRGTSSASSKASEAASAKAKRDESAAKVKAPPVAATPGQSAPPAQSPAAAKEAADAAR